MEKYFKLGDKVSHVDLLEEIGNVIYTDEYGFTTDDFLIHVPWNEIDHYIKANATEV